MRIEEKLGLHEDLGKDAFERGNFGGNRVAVAGKI